MSAKKKIACLSRAPKKAAKLSYWRLISLAGLLCFAPGIGLQAEDAPLARPASLTQDAIASALGWVSSPLNHCGGYYIEGPFTYPLTVDKKNLVEVTSNQGLLSQRNTSTLAGDVTVTRQGEQITSHKAYLYRDLKTGKLSSIDMIGDVHLRQPNTLIIGKEGRYYFQTKAKSLFDIIYRTGLTGTQGAHLLGTKGVSAAALQSTRHLTTMTAWGHASEFAQTAPRVYEMYQTTYSTCPPLNPAWHMKASHITLNKNTGRGTATQVRFYIKNLPVFYFPYLNFSIDHTRKSGFLTPTIGPSSSRWGPYVLLPYYWNMAPNYDMTLTPGYLSKRGIQLTDTFRYIDSLGGGYLSASVLPQDRAFAAFQDSALTNPLYANSSNSSTQAELNQLISDNDTRKDFIWRDNTTYNDHWSSHVDFNYVGDDYYLEDFGGNLNEVTQNQLLQEADLYYKSNHWNFTSTLQAYQTLNPINQTVTLTQYRRLPQFILNGDYPDEPGNVEYFVQSQAAYFDIHNTPGISTVLPIGYRFHLQPGLSLPLYGDNAYINPRLQFALTDYTLYKTTQTGIPNDLQRALPIFDIAAGFTFMREVNLFGNDYHQTLEPQLYYDYIPYRNQSNIPLFDTTLNILAYDQLFNYNRFSSIDRIGDANQLSAGIATRFIDAKTGYQKMRLAIGDIFYFSNRRVTLCNTNTEPFGCSDYPDNPANDYRLSPISGELDYNLNPDWTFNAVPIWDPITKQLVNAVIGLTYSTDSMHVINLGYDYVRNGEILSGATSTNTNNNLKLTDFSIGWPLIGDVSFVGRLSEDWNANHLQNLIYGLQYDTCCWAIRVVGAKVFTGINPNFNNQYQYDTQFYFQFDLKGLTNIPINDPTNLLASINGYNPQFGQEV